MSTKNTNPAVESTKDSSNTSSSTLMQVPITPDSKKGGTGNFHLVYSKKDLQGKPHRMEAKADDRVINKAEIVKDPDTGQDVYLIRVHRGKRVWYGKGVISTETSQVSSTTPEATPATAE